MNHVGSMMVFYAVFVRLVNLSNSHIVLLPGVLRLYCKGQPDVWSPNLWIVGPNMHCLV